jgi:hypothetical protein
MHSRLLRPQIRSTPTQPEGIQTPVPLGAGALPAEAGAQESLQDLPAFQPDPDLFQKWATLEARVAQLSEQVAGLALILLQERDRTVDRRISTLEMVLAELAGKSISDPLLPDPETQAQKASAKAKPAREIYLVEQRARSRMHQSVKASASARQRDRAMLRTKAVMTGENSQQKSEMIRMKTRFALGSSFAHVTPI